MKGKNILVLGSDGMVGSTIFRYLSSFFPETVWGTTRKTPKTPKKLFFQVEHYQEDFSTIKKKIKQSDYVINCIGMVNNNADKNTMHKINAVFPHQLEKIAEKENAQLIHISTDGVFPSLAGVVDESIRPSPTYLYGETKLLGETSSQNALTFRTSFLGFDPIGQEGLLEWARQAQVITGYTNQLWSGCTNLQFAKLCHSLIEYDTFAKMREKSPVFHFAPLFKIVKYDILRTFLSVTKSRKKIIKSQGEPLTRMLRTKYPEMLFLDKQKRDMKEALKELVNYARETTRRI